MEKIILTIDGAAANKEKKQNESLQKKLAKVDKLKAGIKKLKEQLQKYERVYKQQLGVEIKKITKTREVYAEQLLCRVQQKSFSQTHKHQLIELLQEELEFLNKAGYTSEKIDEITKELEEVLNSNIDEQGENILNSLMQQMAAQMGVDLAENASVHNYKEQFEDAFQKKQESDQQEYKEHVKAEKAAQTDKDFYKLYKSLAKKAHPDLVTSSKEKVQREEWMKELSEVWSDRNYVKLLQLSQKITGGEKTSFTIGTTQYKNIMKQLNEEINELEAQKYMMTTHDPLASFYYHNFKSSTEKALQKKMDTYKASVLEDLNELKRNINELRTQKTTRVFLNDIFTEPDYFDDDRWY